MTFGSECFLDQAFHKYRLATAKSKSSTAPERILLAYSGGYSSQYVLKGHLFPDPFVS